MTSPLTDDSLMPYGKHKGKPMQDVPADYLLWLYDNALRSESATAEALRTYIDENRAALEMEVAEGQDDDE